MYRVNKILYLLILATYLGCGDGKTAAERPEKPAETTNQAANNNPEVKEPTTEEEKEAFMDGAVDYTIIAQDFCECAQTAIKTYRETEGLMDPNDKEKYDEYSSQRGKEDDAAIKCCIDAKAKRTSTKLDKLKLSDYLKTECAEMHPSLVIQILLKAIY